MITYASIGCIFLISLVALVALWAIALTDYMSVRCSRCKLKDYCKRNKIKWWRDAPCNYKSH